MKKIYTLLIAAGIISSCSTSSDVVSNSFIQKRKYTKGLNIKKSHFNFGKVNKTTSVNLATIIDEKKEDKTYTFNKVKESVTPSTIVRTSELLVASNPTTPIIEKATRVVNNPRKENLTKEIQKDQVINANTEKVEKLINKIEKRKSKKESFLHKNGPALGIICLLLNLLLLPGLGSIIGGKTKPGIWQLVLLLLGFALTITVIGAILGIPMILTAWIWGIVSGIQIMKGDE